MLKAEVVVRNGRGDVNLNLHLNLNLNLIGLRGGVRTRPGGWLGSACAEKATVKCGQKLGRFGEVPTTRLVSYVLSTVLRRYGKESNESNESNDSNDSNDSNERKEKNDAATGLRSIVPYVR